MNVKKETILVDARLEAMIDKHAFEAVLENGHHLVAFFNRKNSGFSSAKCGDIVEVELSPYNMSKGKIISKKRNM